MTNYHFTGQYLDSALSLQYHRARWLNPTLSTWLSTDPVFDFPGNFGNPYIYVGQDAINRLDTSGTMTSVETVCVSAVVSGLVSMNLALFNPECTQEEALWALGFGAVFGLVGVGVGALAAKFVWGRIIFAMLGVLLSTFGLYQATKAETLEEQLFIGILSIIGLVFSAIVLRNAVGSWLASKTGPTETELAGVTNDPPPKLGTPRKLFGEKYKFKGREVYKRKWDDIDPNQEHPLRPGKTMREAAKEDGLAPYTRNRRQITIHHIAKQEKGPLVPCTRNTHSKLHTMKMWKNNQYESDVQYNKEYNDWVKAFWKAWGKGEH